MTVDHTGIPEHIRHQVAGRRTGERTVELVSYPRGRPERRAVRFWWDEHRRCWVSLPVAGALRRNGRKFFARRLEVAGEDLAGGRLRTETVVFRDPARIEVWWSDLPDGLRAEVDNDHGLDLAVAERREDARMRADLRAGRLPAPRPLGPGSTWLDVVSRERELRAAIGPETRLETAADLWSLAVGRRLASEEERAIARRLHERHRPGLWAYAGD